jgi:hypothetical protein
MIDLFSAASEQLHCITSLDEVVDSIIVTANDKGNSFGIKDKKKQMNKQ